MSNKYSYTDAFFYNRNAEGLDSGDSLTYTLGGIYTYVVVHVIASGVTTGVFNVIAMTRNNDEIIIGAKDLLTNQEVSELNVTATNAKSYLLLSPLIHKLKLTETDAGFDGVIIVEGRKENV